ncbi:MAG: 16S rRNA (cytosine(967)-C(5))-methyltransferase RsmB [Gammaproteobacteria bacterium]
MVNSRLQAARVLCRVLNDGQSLTAALEQFLQSVDSAKDKAFIQALCYGVIRQFYRLDFIISRLLSKPLKDNEIKSLALIGLYQLCYMRVKAHAAVSETVAAVPKKKSWAKPLLNAVLRSYQRQRDDLERQADAEPVALTCHPEWLLEKIEQDWPKQMHQILQANNRQAPMVLRVNLMRIGRDQYLEHLTGLDIAARAVAECPSAIALEQPLPIERLPGFADGLVSVQDSAAQLAAALLNVEAGHRVLDVCAAPGGKAAHILENQPQLGGLVAIDIEESRMLKVKENFQRLNLSSELIVGDAARPESWWDGKAFDRILLDAPCSASGVIRRHPDIKLLRRPEDIAQLHKLQRTILEAIWPLLAPGGVLLYATCSIFKQENEWQVTAFMNDHEDADEWAIEAHWGEARPVGRQILTGQAGMDGFYYARIRKH